MVPACTVKLTATANLLVPDTPYMDASNQYQNYGIPVRRTLLTVFIYTPRDVQNTKRLILESQKSQKEIGRSIGTHCIAIKVSD